MSKVILHTLRVISEDIRNGENLETYLVFLVGLFLTILDIFGVVSFEILAAGILLSLMTLLFNRLVDKNTITALQKDITYLKSKQRLLTQLVPLDPELRPLYREAKKISVSGVSLFRFLPVFQTEFLQALQNGGELRVLLVDPASAAVEMAALRSTSRTPTETQRERILSTLKLLSTWKEQWPGAKIEVKILDYFPPYGITVIRPHIEKGQQPFCLVRLLAFREPTSNAPSIYLNPVNDKEWFNFFEQQFERMWEAAYFP